MCVCVCVCVCVCMYAAVICVCACRVYLFMVETSPSAPSFMSQKNDTYDLNRYKRCIDPYRVVVGYVGDLGKDVLYKERHQMLRLLRNGIYFSEKWLISFAFSTGENTQRLGRNLVLRTRELRFYDLVEYEKYLRWNLEFRFRRVCVRILSSSLSAVLPLDLSHTIRSYLSL